MKTEGISLVTAGMGSKAAPKKMQAESAFDSFMTKHTHKAESRDSGSEVAAAEKFSVSAPAENRKILVKKDSGNDIRKNMDASVKDTWKQSGEVSYNPDRSVPAESVEAVDLSEAAEQVMDAMQDTFGLSEEDLADIMALLGIGVTDLLFQFQEGTVTPIDGQAIKQLVMGVHGIVDSAAFLTSEPLNAEMQQLKEQFTDVLAETFGVAPEELGKVSESLQMDFRERLQALDKGDVSASGLTEAEIPVTEAGTDVVPTADMAVPEMPTVDVPVAASPEISVPAAEIPVMTDAVAGIPETHTPMAETAATAEMPVMTDPMIVTDPTVETPAVTDPEAGILKADVPMAELPETEVPETQVPALGNAKVEMSGTENETETPVATMTVAKEASVSGQREGLSVVVEDHTGKNSQEISTGDAAVHNKADMQNMANGNFEGGSSGSESQTDQQDIQGSRIPAENVSAARDDRPDVPVNLFVERLADAFRESGQTENAGTVSMARIVEQVVRQVRIRLMPETTNMELQLHPASLGRVNLQVSAANGITRATMVVENQAAKEALESQLITLKETFAEQGLKVDSVEVTVSDFGLDHNQGQNAEQGGQNPGGRKFRPEAGTETDAEEPADPHETASERRDVNSVVDYTA